MPDLYGMRRSFWVNNWVGARVASSIWHTNSATLHVGHVRFRFYRRRQQTLFPQWYLSRAAAAVEGGRETSSFCGSCSKMERPNCSWSSWSWSRYSRTPDSMASFLPLSGFWCKVNIYLLHIKRDLLVLATKGQASIAASWILSLQCKLLCKQALTSPASASL